MTNRILTCPYPENINPLSPNGYMFSVQRLPLVTFFCQEVNLPSVTLGTATQNTPFVDTPLPGDKIEYGALTVQFLVDQGMKNYRSIHDWLTGLGFPEDNKQYTQMLEGAAIDSYESAKAFSDATLTILDNTNSPIQTIAFVDLYPESLDSLTFLSTSQDVQYLVGVATFRYSYYKFA